MSFSPVRRVLGDKNANASLNLRSPKAVAKAKPTSECQPSPAQLATFTTAKETVQSTISKVGQKRKFEDSQQPDHSSPRSYNGSDGTSRDASQLSSVSRSYADTNNTSFAVDQNAESEVEPQFELPQEEMSQQTLDKLHNISMPQDDYEPALIRPKLRPEGSTGSAGMSRFINFEENASSQGSDGMQMIENSEEGSTSRENENPQFCPSPATLHEDERKKMLGEKASQLRTRLQLAMFKIQTNQTSRPFKRLKQPVSRREGSSSPPTYTQHIVQGEPPSSLPHLPSLPASQHPANFGPTEPLTLESRVSSCRARATAQVKPRIPSLSSLPVPRIQPTAYSARWTTAPPSTLLLQKAENDEKESEGLNDVELPSSPPLSRVPSAPGDHAHPDGAAELGSAPKTPKTPAVTQSVADIQLSSPPASENGDSGDMVNEEVDQNVQRQTTRVNNTTSLTSSVVKGEAADGLMQLMRGSKDHREK